MQVVFRETNKALKMVRERRERGGEEEGMGEGREEGGVRRNGSAGGGGGGEGTQWPQLLQIDCGLNECHQIPGQPFEVGGWLQGDGGGSPIIRGLERNGGRQTFPPKD